MAHQEFDDAPISLEAVPPSLLELFRLFSRIGLTSFGGGTSAWLYREIVLRKRWVGEQEFFNALALCQALPGNNVSNIAVWLGRRLHGLRGAAYALAGIILFPAILIVLFAALFSYVLQYPITAVLLTGATAAAIAQPFSMGIAMAQRVPRTVSQLGIMAVTFAAIAILKLSLIWVVLGCSGVNIALAYIRQRQQP